MWGVLQGCRLHIFNSCKVKDKVCEHLKSEKINGVEVAVCGMHGSFWRAHACVNYPVSPTAHDLPKGCGYKWVIVKEEIT